MATIGTTHRSRTTAAPRGNSRTPSRGGGRVSPAPRSLPRRKAASVAVRSPADRVLLVGLAMLTMYVGLAGRLFFLQVVRHREFEEAARSQRERAVPLPARRGVLLDRSGTLLVRNEPTVDIIVDPNAWHYKNAKTSVDSPEARQQDVLAKLSALLPGVDIAGALAKRGGIVYLPEKKRWRPITVAERVNADMGAAVKKAKLLGIGVYPSSRRIAIDGSLAPHVIGFTGRDGAGLDGLENGLNEALTGENGILAAEFDVKGRAIPGTVRNERPAEHGRDVVLTIDAGLQNIVQDALRNVYEKRHAEAATAIVMDPKTGDVLACANYPAYNVNNRRGAPLAARANRAVTSPYEPGSTLKLITVAAALEEKKVSPTTNFYCGGARQIGRRTIHCHADSVFPHGHGNEDLEDVIVHSCNVATAECAFRLGKRKLYEYETAFGFGQKTGAGLPGESRGLLKHPDEWSDIQLSNIAFGQGISVTPLQLTAAYSAIANDGVYQRPRIVWGVRDEATQALKPDKPEEGRRVLSTKTARELRRMLQAVVERGTGRNAQLEGYTSGGKTGTAQVAEKGRYSGKYVASFIGMAPMNDPRYVILVAVTDPKNGHYGSEVSAPVFKEIAEKALLARRVPHDKAPEPKGTKGRRGREQRAVAAD
jgi:stage V sporulation protein D (sporulation-specific penicillin-binding protein)